jgi:hypothetical protein
VTFKGKIAGTLGDSSLLPKDLSTNDYDINQALDQKDLHGNLKVFTINVGQKMKCFDNYLSMVSQTYYGLPILPNQGTKGGKID